MATIKLLPVLAIASLVGCHLLLPFSAHQGSSGERLPVRSDGPPSDRPDSSSPADLSQLADEPPVDFLDLTPESCVANCSAVCGANNGCGQNCYSDNDLEPCTLAEFTYWRCVLSAGLQTIARETPISQVCQESDSKGNALYWRTFNINPKNCNQCCGGGLGPTPDPCSQN